VERIEPVILVVDGALLIVEIIHIMLYIMPPLPSSIPQPITIQVLNIEFRENNVIIDVKNLGPGNLEIRELTDFQIFIDGDPAVIKSILPPTVVGGTWRAGDSIRLIGEINNKSPYMMHFVVLFGPRGTQAAYPYYPSG